MKRSLSVLMLSLLCAACICIASACAGGGEGGEGGGKQKYAITVENGNGYTLSTDKTAAEFGETVTITVTITDKNYYLEAVFANGDAAFVYENADGTYNTTIVEDTKITASVAPYVETREDGVASYTGTDYILIGSTMPSYNTENVWDLTVSVDHSRVWSLASSSYARSSDESVIPQRAIGELEPVSHMSVVGSSGTSAVARVIVPIDTTMIAEGTTWLTIYVRADAGVSGADGTICVKITVAETMELAYVSATVEIEYKTYASEGDDVFARFFDEDYLDKTTINGEPATPYTDVTAKVGADGKATFTFNCIVGHRYVIGLSLGTEHALVTVDPAKSLVLESTEVVSGGSNLTGFNQYQNGYLSFAISGSISLSVRGTYEELYG